MLFHSVRIRMVTANLVTDMKSKDERRAEIAKTLCMFSTDDRVLVLLTYAVGRSLERMLGDADRLTLSREQSEMVRHVTDWLIASILEPAPWLERMDAHGRPVKLMKLGSLEAASREADKAMRRQAQKAHGIRLTDGAEEITAELADGYYVVRLLTPEALDAESAVMQHCIGSGAYDASLKREGMAFYSLRDPFGKSHVTIEVKNGWIVQCQGKQNREPEQKYLGLLIPFICGGEWKSRIPITHPEIVQTTDHSLYEIGSLPDGIECAGGLDFSNRPLTSLPIGLRVRGNLDIRGTKITALPDDLFVSGMVYAQDTGLSGIGHRVSIGQNLAIENTPIATLPDDIVIGGQLLAARSGLCRYPATADVKMDVDLRFTPVKELPDGLRIAGSLFLDDCKELKALPEKISVGYTLSIRNTNIDRIPPGCKIGKRLFASGSLIEDIGPQKLWEAIDLSETPIKRLPDGLVVIGRRSQGGLNLSGSAIENLGKGLRVRARLVLSNTPITTLADIQIRGELTASRSKLATIAPSLRVVGSMDISHTHVTELPENLTVTGALIARGLTSLSISSGVSVGKRLDVSDTTVASWSVEGSFGGVKCEQSIIQAMPSSLHVREFLADEAKIDQWPTRMIVEGDFSFRSGTAGTMPEYLSAKRVNCDRAKGLEAPKVIDAADRVQFAHSRFRSYPDKVTAGSGDFRGSELVHLPASWNIGGHLLVDGSKLETIESGLKVFGDFKFSNTPLRMRQELAELQPSRELSVRHGR